MPVQSVHAFAEKVALITNGVNPIGRAVALQLALQGCYVVVGFSETNEENRRVLQELKDLGTLASAIEADISTVEGAKKLVAGVEGMFGRLDLLINTLKFKSDSTFQESSEEVFDKTIAANLKSVFFVTQEAVRLMSARPKPKIVNVISDVSADKGNLAFAATQQGVVGLTESLSKQLGAKFRVNCVAVSDKSADKNNELDAELFRRASGVAEDDVARTILFLLSSEAIGLNGQILRVE
jgi:3-oxoacyl-[acyl-carrier protein] reductase